MIAESCEAKNLTTSLHKTKILLKGLGIYGKPTPSPELECLISKTFVFYKKGKGL